MANLAYDIDGWFDSFGDAFKGKLPADHALIRAYGGQGWRVRTLGVDLALLADQNFPYSKPQAFLECYDRTRPMPHIEPLPELGEMARVCLNSPTLPHEPLLAIRSALHDARELLKANENGDEDGDFESDFAAYWRHYLPRSTGAAGLFGLLDAAPAMGAYIYAHNTYHCFPNKVSLRRWWQHRWDKFVREPHRFPVLVLRRLPRPDRFPQDTETLIAALKRYSSGGIQTVGELLRACPRRLPVVFSGRAPDNRRFNVAIELVLKTDDKNRPLTKAKVQTKLPDEEVIQLYDAMPLDTRSLDAAHTRLADEPLAALRKKVVIVGCGALGSGIATMLAKSGIARLTLVDPELLGWENIRRHELGAEWVGVPKASALKTRLERSIPDLEKVVAYTGTIQTALVSTPNIMADADLVISATGDWAGDVFLNDTIRGREPTLPILYTWTEAFALATHAVLLPGVKGQLTDGFDASGSFKGQASHAARKTPPECGNATSPFGAIEVSQSQSLAVRLALEFLGGRHQDTDVWRTWTSEQSTLIDAEGRWSEYWLGKRGSPPPFGGISEGAWAF
ncbi:MAG: hypothetical protein EOS46_12125 [Mesorhizobium sp.]|uniref:ThiF family adenylyltransferase n=1 Tax=Mesorhizobium sp. TaxID=1871066 RepID=UPI000FE6D1D2|nr:ThiF family adenylyltransferase [Mesorhizobium sp.]RWF47862.1 MAG: hypothetical protein EOS46_12125 [Mesorhizobium sp.]